MGSKISRVLVTGGAGYVGSVLVPLLLENDYKVTVLDLYIHGDDVLDAVKDHPNLQEVRGDIRNRELLKKVTSECDAVIHLACISNDPSFDLDPELGKSINYDAFEDLVDIARDNGVSRFIYASSSSVYGVREEKDVTEELPLKPLTDYSKYKALCEDILLRKRAPGFTVLILRPATVCGYSPRLRLDLTVNILTNHAVNAGVIKVFGGQQMRPNIHIDDVADLYLQSLRWSDVQIDGKVFNAGYENKPVAEIAQVVKSIVGHETSVVTVPTDDMRSYHISSDKIKQQLGFAPKRTIDDAVKDLVAAFRAGRIPDPMNNIRYYNIRMLQERGLK
jgi:nucleoside-diphosphate-sugar epimerase